MPIIAENKGGDYVLMPAGNHLARCYAMVEMGTIKEDTGIYAGKESKKVRLTWETPHESHDWGKGFQPFSISKEFTLSMHEKATLRKMLESWRGKPFTESEAEKFDVTALLGKPCMINVIHKKTDKGEYSQISSIASLPKGMVCPDQVNHTFELSYDNWNTALFDTLPDFVKNKMKTSKEYLALHSAPVNEVAMEDDGLPF